ncbi:MAG: RagB/SusD family nutrient uptake outer membrane protein [Tenacibaculum sp.]
MRKYIIIYAIASLLAGCENGLNKEVPFISENLVFEEVSLTEAYMANLYIRSYFQHSTDVNMGVWSAVGAEHINFADWQNPNQAYLRKYSAASGPFILDRWGYDLIRDINFLLENLPSSKALETEYIKQKIIEARFLRAFEYFEMVKRFGGVPLITKVQSLNDPESELFPGRSKEQEIYDFIYEETQAILPFFDNLKTGAQGRVDKYTTLMLQSRAMLYAASISKNSTVQKDGQVGIPSSTTNSYYKKSHDASQQVISSGMFSLLKGDDKVANYASIFTDEGNNEIIFAELFEPVIKGHSLDYYAFPQGFASTWNSNFPVLYDFVELFDFVDGRKGTSIDRSDLIEGNEWDIDDFFGNRDPRFRASVFYPESEFQGQNVWFHESMLLTEAGEQIKVNETGSTRTRTDGTQMPEASLPRNRRNTSLLRRKRVDESNLEPLSGRSGQDYIIYRYGETLLNFAEAAFYLGKTRQALDALNQIRERAGMPLLTEVTEENLRHERQIELCFEDHRFWDLIRWRIADKYLNNIRTKGLVFKYNLDTDKYIITLKNAEPKMREFGEERYYLPFSLSRLADLRLKPEQSQNPGY